MHLPFNLLIIFLIAYASTSFADELEIEHWLEMSDACEAIVFDQNLSVFDGLEPADPLVNIGGLYEVAVFNPDASLIASAVSSQGRWFICIVAANPSLQVSRAGSLIHAWYETQHRRAQSVESKLVDLNDKTTFSPVRVRCAEKGGLVVVMAFEYETDEFRVGVTNRLPSSVENPCLN